MAKPYAVVAAIENLVEVYYDDPVAFFEDMLRMEVDDWQKAVLYDLAHYPWVAVRSGQGVGKTALEAGAFLWFVCTRPNSKLVATAPTRPQLEIVLWPEISKWLESSLVKSLLTYTATRISMRGKRETWFGTPRTAVKPENMQGVHADHMLFIVDEASGIREDIMEAIFGTLSGEENKLLMCGNPTQTTGTFYDAFHKDRKSYKTHKISSRNVKRTNKQNIAKLERKYGKDSNVVRVRVDGEFPRAEPDVLISLELCENAVMTDVDTKNGPIVIGADIARFGDDSTVLYPRIGGCVQEPEVYHKLSTTEVTGHIIALANKLLLENPRPVVYVYVDVGAMGAGVVDELIEQTHGQRVKWVIVSVNFGGTSDDPDCDDKATEMYKHAKDLMQERSIHIPNHVDTIAQLSSRKYRMTIKGKLKLEPKDEYKKRTHESPDFADACVLCLMESAVNVSRDMQTAKVKPVTAGLNSMRF